MEKAPALDPMQLYEFCMVAFYRGAPAPGAPVVPTPLRYIELHSFESSKVHQITFF